MSDPVVEPARRATDVPRPKWRLLVPIFVLLVTAGALTLLPRFKAVSTGTGATQVTASVTETTADKSLPGSPMTVSIPPAAAPRAGEGREHTTVLTLDMMKEREQYHTQRQQWMVQTGISLIMALAAVFIILSKKYPEDCNKWAYSTIAFIMGYWLKS